MWCVTSNSPHVAKTVNGNKTKTETLFVRQREVRFYQKQVWGKVFFNADVAAMVASKWPPPWWGPLITSSTCCTVGGSLGGRGRSGTLAGSSQLQARMEPLPLVSPSRLDSFSWRGPTLTTGAASPGP